MATDIEEMSEFTEIEVEEILETENKKDTVNPYKFNGLQLIAPAVLLGVGIAGVSSHGLRHLNREIADKIGPINHKKFGIENFTIFVPALAAYGLNLCGVKGLHNYAELSVIMGTAYLLMAATVFPTKEFVKSQRPTGFDYNSFPSGHTCVAFVGAEILRHEFWEVSPWIGVAGYLIAAGSGFMRIYNGAHWLTDVVAGAGLGILCAQAAYWLYPAITKHLFPSLYKANLFLSPAVSTKSIGLGASITF